MDGEGGVWFLPTGILRYAAEESNGNPNPFLINVPPFAFHILPELADTCGSMR